VYLTLNTISPPKVVTQLPKPNKDLSGLLLKLTCKLLLEPAKRRSDNRPRGTPVNKTMKVDRITIRSYMISYLLPAIKIIGHEINATKLFGLSRTMLGLISQLMMQNLHEQ
jgi:hypothetical protein